MHRKLFAPRARCVGQDPFFTGDLDEGTDFASGLTEAPLDVIPFHHTMRHVQSLAWTFFALCLLLYAVCGASAWAAPPGVALRFFEEGNKAFQRGRYEQALRAFQSSLELEPSPNTRFKVAITYAALGKTASAYLQFKRTASEALDRANATGEKRYLPTRDAALREASALEAQVPHLSVTVPSDVPDGFQLSIDGNAVPRSTWGLAFEVDPGVHKVVATGPRMRRFEKQIALAAGETKRIDIAVVRQATATLRFQFAQRPAGLSLDLDGRPVPPEQFESPHYVDVGEHAITALAPGYLPFAWRARVVDRAEVEIAIAFQAQPLTQRAVPPRVVLATGAAALVTLGIGIGFGVKAKLAADEQLALDPLQRSIQVQDAIRTDAIVANVFFGIGGALGITTAVLGGLSIWKRKPLDAGPKKVKPETSIEHVNLLLSGQSIGLYGSFR